MHKYQPRVHIIKKVDDSPHTTKSNHIKLNLTEDLEKFELCKTFIFPETEFIAVTAYQNQLVS